MEMAKIQAQGPWVFVKVDTPPTKTEGGTLYIPDGTVEQRTGLGHATVISAGQGIYDKKGRLEPTGLKPGDRIAFRGFLKDANRPDPFDGDHCFLHVKDVLGTLE